MNPQDVMYDRIEQYEDQESEEEFLDVMLYVAIPRRPKRYQNRPDYFEILDEQDFMERFRLPKVTVHSIIDQIRNNIASRTTRNRAVTPEEKVLLTLRFYATGSFVKCCADFVGVHESTASRIIPLVSHCIARLRPAYVKMPQTNNEKAQVSQEFFDIAKFPRCLGAIDCTHIRIRSPGGTQPETHRNRKGWFSINVQTVSDAKLRIRNIVARWPGSAHDAFIFRSSSLKARFWDCNFSI